MGVARDIALIFLSLEALVVALVPLVLVSALAYGVYRLRLWIRDGLRTAQEYAQMAQEHVERASTAIAEPFIQIHYITRMVVTIVNNLVSRRRL